MGYGSELQENAYEADLVDCCALTRSNTVH